ncbi:hypothetical protein CCUS01_07860 [Colletotrichum cuscutae]|uniref:Uncharacterized protein n=1 Tax=Colletotrichum cuscutae TaxID=1209917 RepID=A0AAI9UW79_9PEZI|nr:hypothetical protein CCUS01_07860 [Colletotrichum cuscutae]
MITSRNFQFTSPICSFRCCRYPTYPFQVSTAGTIRGKRASLRLRC